MDLPFRKSKKGVILRIKVEPRSSGKGIAGVLGEIIKVKLHAPPVGGAANEELIEVLSEELKVKKRVIKIISGQSSKNKVIEIEGIEAL